MSLRTESVIESRRAKELPRLRALLVSEDPEFIVEMQETMRPHGVQVVACMGPAQGPCALDEEGRCPMAERVSVVVVDAPRSGAFVRHWKVVPAGDYAAHLADVYPDAFVALAAAPLAAAGPTGDVAHVKDRRAVVELLRWLAYVPPNVSRRNGNGNGKGGDVR